jgi:hypothetical protein
VIAIVTIAERDAVDAETAASRETGVTLSVFCRSSDAAPDLPLAKQRLVGDLRHDLIARLTDDRSGWRTAQVASPRRIALRHEAA